MTLRAKSVSPTVVGFLCIVTLMLSGCNTPQQKAHNSPTPIPPPPQQTSQQDSSKDTSGGQQQTEQQTQSPGDPGNEKTATSSQQNQSAEAQKSKPTNTCDPSQPQSAPDVEITDVPLDQNGNPIEPDTNTVAATEQAEQECQTAKNSQQEQQRNAEKQMRNNQAAGQQQQATGQRAASGGASGATARTGEEKLAAANADMDSRLSAFDELMRRAREAAEQERAAANGGSTGQYGGRGGSQLPPRVRGQGGQADTSSGLGHTPDHSGETPPGDYTQVARGPVPANIPDGRDDDIVARQLREAASKETDPVLREKLWEEYKKYKTGIIGR